MAAGNQFERGLKRAIDLTVATVGLFIAAPVLALAGIAIAVTMGRPVLFRQRRPGLGEKLFTIYKLRTMGDWRDRLGRPLTDAERLTPLGAWLRGTSLDELPQLWNVWKGEMSLVGPRPLLPEYLGRYTPEQRRRHEVRPGITGLAQTSGRNAIGWHERLCLDTEYVDRWSVWLDVRILFATLRMVIVRDGISNTGHATMPEFAGTAEPEANNGVCL